MIKQCILLKSTWTFQERYETEETTACPVVTYRSGRPWGVFQSRQAAVLPSSGETVGWAGACGNRMLPDTPSSYPGREISCFFLKTSSTLLKTILLLPWFLLPFATIGGGAERGTILESHEQLNATWLPKVSSAFSCTPRHCHRPMKGHSKWFF